MRKLNEKGFLLAESIVVGVFILTLFTVLFVNFVPMLGRYEADTMYDDVDSVYKTHLIRNMILTDIEMNPSSNSTTEIFGRISSLHNYYYFSNNTICNYLANKEYCKVLLSEDYLDVSGIIVTPFNISKFKDSLKNVHLSRNIESYVESLPKYDQPASYANYKRIIVEYSDGHIANLEVRVNVSEMDRS